MYHYFQEHWSLRRRLLSSSGIRALKNAKNAKNAENPEKYEKYKQYINYYIKPKFYAELEYSG